jgi:hypothetical protein
MVVVKSPFSARSRLICSSDSRPRHRDGAGFHGPECGLAICRTELGSVFGASVQGTPRAWQT